MPLSTLPPGLLMYRVISPTDSYFRAEEAVSFGLADQIITSLS